MNDWPTVTDIIFPCVVREAPDGCWWPDDRIKCGDYISVKYNGNWWPAHRLSYCLNVFEISCAAGSRTEGFVLHTCDDKWCCRPSHLYLGTQKQNMRDTVERNPVYHNGTPENLQMRVNKSLAKIGKNHPMFGKHHTPERRSAISATLTKPCKIFNVEYESLDAASLATGLPWRKLRRKLIDDPDESNHYISRNKKDHKND